MSLMKSIRESIKEETFPNFVEDFMQKMYPEENYPEWVTDSLKSVGIHLT